MTSARAYRPARSSGEALSELWRCAGAQFDAEVVQALAGALPSLSAAASHVPGSAAGHPEAPRMVLVGRA
jgi:HD-GYP domain-containing protein (c-di-GMP phosphodiesterase class II)